MTLNVTGTEPPNRDSRPKNTTNGVEVPTPTTLERMNKFFIYYTYCVTVVTESFQYEEAVKATKEYVGPGTQEYEYKKSILYILYYIYYIYHNMLKMVRFGIISRLTNTSGWGSWIRGDVVWRWCTRFVGRGCSGHIRALSLKRGHRGGVLRVCILLAWVCMGAQSAPTPNNIPSSPTIFPSGMTQYLTTETSWTRKSKYQHIARFQQSHDLFAQFHEWEKYQDDAAVITAARAWFVEMRELAGESWSFIGVY